MNDILMMIKSEYKKYSMRSLYLKENRLSDIITAIQIMGSYQYAGRKPDDWQNYICRQPQSDKKWRSVFSEHPEFFLFKDDLVFLVWRRAADLMVNLKDKDEKITSKQYLELDEEKKKEYSWLPLEYNQIEVLIHSAIKMHTCAIETNKDKRWAVPIWIALIGVLGTLFATTLK